MDYIKSVLDLRYFIENHLNDDCGNWEYQHSPYIKSIIGSLSEDESDFLSRTIWTWPPKVLYELADAILDTDNHYLNENFMYCRIFSLIHDIEDLEYLAQNLGACFYSLQLENVDIKILKAIQLRLTKVFTITADQNWKRSYSDLIRTIQRLLN